MRRKNNNSIGVLFIFGLIIGGVLYLYNSAQFERVAPTITLANNSGYWNLKSPLKFSFDDSSGVVSYRVSLEDGENSNSLLYEELETPKTNIKLEVKPPRSARAIRSDFVTIIVEARDASRWNFLAGNKTKHKIKLIIDKKRPNLTIINNSYKISEGGSAVVIFRATDDNLDSINIETSFGKTFIAQPFYKEGYYISLLAWPVVEPNFKATIVVTDLAGNRAKSYVPLYLKEKNYKISNIKIKDRFLKGKIANLAEEFDETQGVDASLEQFKIINEDVRAKNEELIHELTSKVPQEMITNFNINRMYPLKNAQVVARFGDHRKYSYDGSPLSESYHLGLDLASNALASIKPQNSGTVVYSDYNGIYGYMPVIYHGLGLYTLYGHCSSLSVGVGEEIRAKQEIAKSGKSGYAMGDHLHFGVLVQGIEVRPQEWMDKTWLKQNIKDIIKKAKKIIDRK